MIRAFEQEEAIIARQNALLDATTMNFVAHHSVNVWYHLRMLWTSMMFPVLTILTCAMNKGIINNIYLVIALTYSVDVTWLFRLFTSFTWF